METIIMNKVYKVFTGWQIPKVHYFTSYDDGKLEDKTACKAFNKYNLKDNI